jgi:hypothetical protein
MEVARSVGPECGILVRDPAWPLPALADELALLPEKEAQFV